MVEMLLGSCTVVMPLPRNASIPICVTLWGITADFRCSVIMNACVPMDVSADGSNTSSTPEHAKALSGIRVIWVCERSTRFSRSQ